MNKQEIGEFGMLKQKVSDIDSKLDLHTTEQREDFDKVFAKLDSLEGKFAGKWVEKVAIGVSIGVLVTIITLIISI